jgi:hypothetical protein
MRLQSELRRHLAIECSATLEARDGRQKAVEITPTSPEPATVKGESYPWNQGKVQFV